VEHPDVELLAVGALSPEETGRVERHLATCEVCRERFRLSLDAVTLLPEALTPISPPEEIRSRILRDLARISWRARLSWAGLGAACLAILGLLGWSTVSLWQLRREVAAVQESLALHRQLIVTLWSQSARVVPLLPVNMRTPQVKGMVVVRPLDGQTELVILVTGLRPPAQRAVYQAWLQQGARRRSVGILQIDAAGIGLLRYRLETDVKAYEGLGITFEPDGPAPMPRGTRILNARF